MAIAGSRRDRDPIIGNPPRDAGRDRLPRSVGKGAGELLALGAMAPPGAEHSDPIVGMRRAPRGGRRERAAPTQAGRARSPPRGRPLRHDGDPRGRATRLDLAKQWVRDAIASQDPEDRIGLAAAGHTLEAIAAPSRDRAGLLASLARLEIEEVGSDLAAAGAALEGFPKQTILVSDLAGTKVGLPRTHVVGSESENLGIVDLRVEDPFPDSDARVTATIRNGGRAEKNAVVTVERGGEEAARGEARVPAGGETQLSISFPRGRGGLPACGCAPATRSPSTTKPPFSSRRRRRRRSSSFATPRAPRPRSRRSRAPSPSSSASRSGRWPTPPTPPPRRWFSRRGKVGKAPGARLLWGVECPELDRAGAAPRRRSSASMRPTRSPAGSASSASS